MFDLFVVDFGPMGDLMFWGQFGRHLASDSSGRRMIVVGSGEKTEGLLGGPGVVSRQAGALHFDADQEAVFERGMREELKSVVSGLTDEGVSTVGFSGLDRNLFSFADDDERQISVGERALKSAGKWASDGVVSVLSSVVRAGDSRLRDVHPARTAGAVSRTLGAARILVVAQRVTEDLKRSKGSSLSIDEAGRSLASPAPVRALVESNHEVLLWHPSLGATSEAAELTS